MRSRYSDSGVVTRMCGGFFCIARRSAGGVSPVRVATVTLGDRQSEPLGFGLDARPAGPAGSGGRQLRAPAAARRRAPAGPAVLVDPGDAGVRRAASMATRKPVRVLPGAGRRGDEHVLPWAMRGQAADLGLGRALRELPAEPRPHDRVEQPEDVAIGGGSTRRWSSASVQHRGVTATVASSTRSTSRRPASIIAGEDPKSRKSSTTRPVPLKTNNSIPLPALARSPGRTGSARS